MSAINALRAAREAEFIKYRSLHEKEDRYLSKGIIEGLERAINILYVRTPSEIPNSSPPREWTLGWEQWVGVRAEEGPTLEPNETVRVREIQPNSSRGGER